MFTVKKNVIGYKIDSAASLIARKSFTYMVNYMVCYRNSPWLYRKEVLHSELDNNIMIVCASGHWHAANPPSYRIVIINDIYGIGAVDVAFAIPGNTITLIIEEKMQIAIFPNLWVSNIGHCLLTTKRKSVVSLLPLSNFLCQHGADDFRPLVATWHATVVREFII